MSEYKVVYHEKVGDDLSKIQKNIKVRIKRAIENRLMIAPMQYGERLSNDLTGLWKIRVGDYRIVYEINKETVIIWGVQHRKGVYPAVVRRWLSF